ncbi:type II toxin-antitoxin system VapC family toxin [Sinorhizobium fredii]|uniref:PIN domain-containing protein n=1 Tax=Rhizobium fredii TaxID=380 RepID=A0A2A6LW19_RHIFR|nr:type II toxin-antitoxin system VapC family toxin [Sinorhizobium fredii]PDT46527.1 PIN domain-containing protein [Sinorhizobium fredii]
MTLVDTNVLLDVVTDDPEWADWSIAALEAASLDGPLLINDMVYAELAVRYDRIEQVDAFLSEAGLELAPTPRAALFLAGKVFTQYRRSGGARTGVLPDFFIGAYAAVGQLPLLTRDTGRYRTYFPSLTVIAECHLEAAATRPDPA